MRRTGGVLALLVTACGSGRQGAPCALSPTPSATEAPSVRIVGRTEKGTEGLRFSWPGVSFAARFRGAQASIGLADGGSANEFEVIVDGQRSSTLVTRPDTRLYPVASGLVPGEHTVLVWRRTEAYYNPTEFLGFSDFGPGGALLAPPPARRHRLEAIGDSLTVGYGNEGQRPCVASTTNENNYLAYASVAAREVDADLVTIAWSGIGVYRNYGDTGPSADTMPVRYDRAIPTDPSSTWDFSRFDPEAVVINLGTNDFSTHGDPGQPFVDAYATFLAHVRSRYPRAFLLCLVPRADTAADITQAVATVRARGENAIATFDLALPGGDDGCDYHPSVAKDQAMGVALAGELRRVLGW